MKVIESNKKKVKNKIRRGIGVFLSITGIVLLIIAILPFSPEINWQINALRERLGIPKIETVNATNALDEIDFTVDTVDIGNLEDSDSSLSSSTYRIVIPAIGVDMEVITDEKDPQKAMLEGAWFLPGSGEPDKPDLRKNTVIAAHRFLYSSGPKTFYHLDKVQVGDDIFLYWQGKKYHYQMTLQQIVLPSAVEILDDTDKQELTLFTCHPVYSTKERLVIKADLIEEIES